MPARTLGRVRIFFSFSSGDLDPFPRCLELFDLVYPAPSTAELRGDGGLGLARVEEGGIRGTDMESAVRVLCYCYCNQLKEQVCAEILVPNSPNLDLNSACTELLH